MSKLQINLQNCFGIRQLEHVFDFSKQNSVLIYAPNGVMKSSFAKTLSCIAKNDKKDIPRDLIYTHRVSKANVLLNDKNIAPNMILVADAEKDINNNDKITTLLASKELKDQYDDIYRSLDGAKNDFLKQLKEISQSSDCENEIISTFKNTDRDDVYACLLSIRNEIQTAYPCFTFKYNDIFDKKGKVKSFLEKYKDLIENYFREYAKLLEKSVFFHTNDEGNSFGTYQARQIIESVGDDAFFDAKHKLLLNNGKEIVSKEELQQMYDAELRKILDDDKLRGVFDKIDTAIGTNAELRAFKIAIEKDNSIITELVDYEGFQKRVWYGYLHTKKTEVEQLLELYLSKKKELAQLLNNAKKEKEIWKDIVDLYNDRFYVPFRVAIKNQEDVILKQETANLVFLYKDEGDGDFVEKQRNEIIEVLSRGERRAFFILQLLFEIEVRKQGQQESLIVLDDIADSFDYKNKYAIIEYIVDLNKDNLFKMIL